MDFGYYGSGTGGILEVAGIVAQHRHAVARDLIAMGYHGDAPIEIGDLVSIVLASPPGSSVRYFAEGGWSQTDHLLANYHEQLAGLTHLPEPYERPGTPQEQAEPNQVPITNGTPKLTPQTREEFEARRKRDMARGAELAATEKKIAH